MKTRLFKSILAIAMMAVALPMMGQDYMNIYFKDGNKVSFYLKAVKNFYVSKYDSLGLIHSDYQTQIIETQIKTFIFDLIEIDSISFTKFNEKEVRKNFSAALRTSDAVFSKCESITDLSQHIDELREAEGIEYVSYDDNCLFVGIKDWLTIAYYFDPSTSNEETRSLSRTIKKGERLIQQYGSPYEDISAVAAFSLSSVGKKADDYEKYFVPLKEEFEECRIPTKLEHFPSLTNNFYTEEIFKHDFVFYAGHGGYNEELDLYTLQTADEWGTRPTDYVLTEEEKTQFWDWISSLLNNNAVAFDDILMGISNDLRPTLENPFNRVTKVSQVMAHLHNLT